MMANILYGNKILDSFWVSLVLNNHKTFKEKLYYAKSFVNSMSGSVIPGDHEVCHYVTN